MITEVKYQHGVSEGPTLIEFSLGKQSNASEQVHTRAMVLIKLAL